MEKNVLTPYSMIYHYTTIETLALILESKKIRFNSLNNVDDIQEGSLLNKKNLDQFVFVSCWTKNPEENIALWKMYTQGKGVRIGFSDYPWKRNPIEKDKWETNGIQIRGNSDDFHSPFTYDEINGKNHFILPPFSIPGNKAFSRSIIYLDDDELAEKYRSIYYSKIDRQMDRFEIYIPMLELGIYKHKRWAFQEEFRFILFICPTTAKPNFLNEKDNLINDLKEYIEFEKVSPIKDFYVSLDNMQLITMEVVLGPLCTKGDEIIVKTLMNGYGLSNLPLKSKIGIRR